MSSPAAPIVSVREYSARSALNVDHTKRGPCRPLSIITGNNTLRSNRSLIIINTCICVSERVYTLVFYCRLYFFTVRSFLLLSRSILLPWAFQVALFRESITHFAPLQCPFLEGLFIGFFATSSLKRYANQPCKDISLLKSAL